MHTNAQTPASFSPAPREHASTRSAAEQAVTDHAEEGGRGGTEGLTMRRQTTVASVTS